MSLLSKTLRGETVQPDRTIEECRKDAEARQIANPQAPVQTEVRIVNGQEVIVIVSRLTDLQIERMQR